MVARNPARISGYDLARELGVSAGQLLSELEQLGEFLRAPSAAVPESAARKLRLIFPVGELPAQTMAALRERRIPDAACCLEALRRHDQETWILLRSEIGGLIAEGISQSRAEWLTRLWLATSRTAAELAPQLPRTAEPSDPSPSGGPPARSSPPGLRRAAGQRPEESGELLEDGFAVVLRTMFELAGHRIAELRPQLSGTQYGHDFNTETIDPRGATIRCHVECKNQTKTVGLQEIAPKLLEQLLYWDGTHFDYFVVVAPRTQVANEIRLLAQLCNERLKFPFQILVWSTDQGVDELIELNPDLYSKLYARGVRVPDPQRREEIAQRWASRLLPIPRVPDSVKQYLNTPDRHLLYGESDFEAVRADPIALGALDRDGRALPGRLHDAVRGWLAEPQSRPLLLLAEFGDGKSFFGYELGLQLAEEYLANPSGGWICLRISLRSLRGGSDPASMLERRLLDIGVSGTEWLTLTRSGRTLVILDGFDEMSARLDQETLDANTAVLASCVAHFHGSKVMISSRAHLFDRVTDYQRFIEDLGDPQVLRIAPISLAARVAHLEAYAARIGKTAALARLKTLNDPIALAAKPLFLQMIKAVLPALYDDKSLDEITLYKKFVGLCLERKVDDLQSPGRPLGPKKLIANLKELLKALAVELHTSADDYVNLRDFSPRGQDSSVPQLLWEMTDTSSVTTETDARSRIGSRSVLKQVAGIDPERWPVDFFHRSMREFFVAQALVDSIAALDGSLLETVPLQAEIVDFARLLISRSPDGPDIFTHKLVSLTRSAILPLFEQNYRGGNALTLLHALVPDGLLPWPDWSGLALDYADLSGADLSGMSFRGSSLRNALLDNARLTRADLSDADLTGVRLEQTGAVEAVSDVSESGVVYVAYRDQSVRRWEPGPVGRTRCETIATLDFAPNGLDLSPFGDLLIFGSRGSDTRITEIISPSGTAEMWQVLSSFQTSEETPAAGTSVSRPYFPDNQPDCSGSTGSTCTHSLEIGDGEWLLAVGRPSGSVSLWRWAAEHNLSPRDGAPSGWNCLWSEQAHNGPVTDVRVSRTHLVSGGDDGTICVYTLTNDWSDRKSLVLHRSFECEDMLIDGVRDAAAKSMLESLRDFAADA